MSKRPNPLQLRAARDAGRDPRVALQFVRKISGFNSPSKANQAAFDRAIDDVSDAVRVLIDSLVTAADPRNREVEAANARALSAKRFGPRAGSVSSG